MFGEFKSRSVKTRDAVENFLPALEFSQTFPSFLPGYEGTEKMFYFFYKIISILKKEKDDIRSAYVYFNFSHETVNFHVLETANHIAHVIFVLRSACRPIKTFVLSKLFYKVD